MEMISRKIKLKQVDRSTAKDYIKKAADNHEAMLLAFEKGNFNSVGTLAIQCAISSADAVCVYEKGLRSISQDHGDICDLVKSTQLPDAQKKCKTLKGIIAKKNLIQYESRNVYLSEAQDLLKATTRFYQWAASVVKS